MRACLPRDEDEKRSSTRNARVPWTRHRPVRSGARCM